MRYLRARSIGVLLFIIAAHLVINLKSVAWTEELGSQEELKPPSIEEIEAAINALNEFDVEKIIWIRSAISQQDIKKRGRLDKALHDKLDAFFEIEAVPQEKEELKDTLQLQELPSFEELRIQISALNLGPDATVGDLRERDKLIAEIAKIQDPNLRYKLLQYLETKEKSAQTE